jgi:predicted O-linked N-acetylglucosamine transferase (SPINDLY family)
MGRITNGVFDHLSRERFCVCAIFVPPVTQDKFSNAFQRKADKTVFLPNNLKEARETIAAEKFDILFYPEIGMDPFTYFLAFARLAPIQCVSFGHPVTSGISNIDYYVSAENLEPKNAEKHYSERLIRLKSPIAYYYKPDIPHSLQSRKDFGLRDTEHVYVCPHTLFKFHPDFDEVLAGIMKADPLARLVIIHFPSAQWAEKLLQRFQRTIPNAKDRITVLPPLRERAWLSLLAVSDVILDTVHFSGYVSGHYAMAVGTPVVTWPGKFLRGRLMLALYKEMGVLDCIADSPSRYVEIAVRLGTDPAYREGIKARIRANRHRLYENPAVVDEYERVLLKMARDAGLSV